MGNIDIFFHWEVIRNTSHFFNVIIRVCCNKNNPHSLALFRHVLKAGIKQEGRFNVEILKKIKNEHRLNPDLFKNVDRVILKTKWASRRSSDRV